MKKRISHYQRVAEIAYATAKRLLPLYRHKNSPHRFTWPQLAACVLMTYYLYCRYQDSVLLKSLRRQSRSYAIRNHVLLADAGFDGRQIKLGDVIPPVRRHGALRAPERIARAELVAQARLDGLYGQRWKCETVH